MIFEVHKFVDHKLVNLVVCFCFFYLAIMIIFTKFHSVCQTKGDDVSKLPYD